MPGRSGVEEFLTLQLRVRVDPPHLRGPLPDGPHDVVEHVDVLLEFLLCAPHVGEMRAPHDRFVISFGRPERDTPGEVLVGHDAHRPRPFLGWGDEQQVSLRKAALYFSIFSSYFESAKNFPRRRRLIAETNSADWPKDLDGTFHEMISN